MIDVKKGDIVKLFFDDGIFAGFRFFYTYCDDGKSFKLVEKSSEKRFLNNKSFIVNTFDETCYIEKA